MRREEETHKESGEEGAPPDWGIRRWVPRETQPCPEDPSRSTRDWRPSVCPAFLPWRRKHRQTSSEDMGCSASAWGAEEGSRCHELVPRGRLWWALPFLAGTGCCVRNWDLHTPTRWKPSRKVCRLNFFIHKMKKNNNIRKHREN